MAYRGALLPPVPDPGGPGSPGPQACLALAAVGAVYLTARRRGADLRPTALLLLFALSGMPSVTAPSGPRFSPISFLPSSSICWRTPGCRGAGRKLWLLAPIQIVWCNLHGGFLAGLGLIFLYALGEALSRRPFRPYLVWFLMAGLATLINPYGLKYWSYLAQAVTMPRPEITEWVSHLEGYKQGFVGGL